MKRTGKRERKGKKKKRAELDGNRSTTATSGSRRLIEY